MYARYMPLDAEQREFADGPFDGVVIVYGSGELTYLFIWDGSFPA